MRLNEFTAGCLAQGVEVYSIYPTGQDASDYYISCSIGDLLRCGKPLSSGPVDSSFCKGDTIAMAHLEIINSTHGFDEGTYPQFPMLKKYIPNCSGAEQNFGQWLDGIASNNPVGGRVVVDKNGAPVGVQKAVRSSESHFGEPSMMLLEKVALIQRPGILRNKNPGVILPAGSLVYASFARRGPLNGNQPLIERCDQIKGMSFLRMAGVCIPEVGLDWAQYVPNISRSKFMYLDKAIEVVKKFIATKGLKNS